MTVTDHSLPQALQRAVKLLTSPPDGPEVRHGYLDLLGEQTSPSPSAIQSLWASTGGSAAYDSVQALARKFLVSVRLPESARRPPAGGQVLDIGCGPGNITASLGRAVGDSGLALGLDVSEPMLQRAVRAHATDNVGFLRADARELPFRDGIFDAVVSMLALQLIPEPLTALGEMVRVLAPEARLTILVPTATGTMFHKLAQLSGTSGIAFFEPDEVAEALHDHGMQAVHTRQNGPMLWIMARRA